MSTLFGNVPFFFSPPLFSFVYALHSLFVLTYLSVCQHVGCNNRTHDLIPLSCSQERNRSFIATDYTAIRKELENSAFHKGLIDVAFITPEEIV